jgi:hypothetical protein
MNLKRRRLNMFNNYDIETNKPIKLSPWDIVTKYLTFVAVLIAALSYFTREVPPPTWATVVLSGFLIVLTLIGLRNLLLHPYKKFLEKRKEEKYTRLLSSQMYTMINEFNRLISSGDNDTIIYWIRNILGWPEIQKHQINLLFAPINGHIGTIQSWSHTIQSIPQSYNVEAFKYIIEEFCIITRDYHSICVELQKQLESLAISGQLPPDKLLHLKQEWNLRREKYVNFLSEWRRLGADINRKFGNNTCNTYYESLKTLV